MPCKEGYNIYFPFFPASKTCFKFFTGSTFLLSKKEQKQTIIISEREKGKRIQPHHCWRAAPMRARANSDHFCARAQIKQLSFFRRTIWRSRARGWDRNRMPDERVKIWPKHIFPNLFPFDKLTKCSDDGEVRQLRFQKILERFCARWTSRSWRETSLANAINH